MNKCLERVDDRHFWTPEVFSYAMIPRCCPNSRVFFFFIVTSIVYGFEGERVTIRIFLKEEVMTYQMAPMSPLNFSSTVNF
jgi:hypothetical protein